MNVLLIKYLTLHRGKNIFYALNNIYNIGYCIE